MTAMAVVLMNLQRVVQFVLIGKNKERLSKYVECYESPHLTSTYVYDDIKNNIEQLIEDAISNAGTY